MRVHPRMLTHQVALLGLGSDAPRNRTVSIVSLIRLVRLFRVAGLIRVSAGQQYTEISN
jgi:hypothetical protein